ncbi:MAG TPA: serine hydrolase domain-containing protein [Flavitalea sp.]|nr:serine hydrolase domain-containing protein [Flavitalea sp.]
MKQIIRILPLLVFIGCSGKNDKAQEPSTPAIAAVAPTSAGLSPSEASNYRKIAQRFYDSLLGRGRFNGSFLVAKNGEIVYEHYAGFRNPRIRKDSITPSTSFHLASVSKTFTAMATLKLWEEGKLQIDAPVATYLTGFPIPDVTVRMLLNHRSGIPNYVHYMERLGWDRKKAVTNQDVLDFIIARKKDIQLAKPDTHFSYSNTNYALLALIIEKVSGQNFGEFLRLTFFEPLGMKDTYVFNDKMKELSLSSYFYSGREYAFDYLDMVYGDKNIYSTVRDLLKWDQALNGGLMFKRETLEAAYTGYSNEKKGINNYGLGWRMQLLPNGKKFIYHNGWWHGNRTAFYRLIDENATIIALSNNDYTPVYKSKKLADVFGNYFGNRSDDSDMEQGQTVLSNSASISRSRDGGSGK